jgi:hypothetical protein
MKRETVHEIFREAFESIPDFYKERYGIGLITANEFTKFPVIYAEIKEAKLSIFPNGEEILISEDEEKLIVKIGKATIHMYKKVTLIYTFL